MAEPTLDEARATWQSADEECQDLQRALDDAENARCLAARILRKVEERMQLQWERVVVADTNGGTMTWVRSRPK